MNKDKKIYVSGHTGMLGSHLIERLESEGFSNLCYTSSSNVDLTRQNQTEEYLCKENPDIVVHCAAIVGGILANDRYSADFIYDNLMMESNVIHAAHKIGVDQLVFIGSSCIYPKHCPQPMKEEHLLTGELEPTNQWYATAKIAGIKMCQAYRKQHGDEFISLMPTNLYGKRDNFDLETSHVLAAFIRKFHEAEEEVEIWGTGKPKREFLHVEDLVDAILFLLNTEPQKIWNEAPDGILNIGSSEEVTVNELASIVSDVVDFDGEIIHDYSKPDGTPRKFLDTTRMDNLGWSSNIGLREGIERTYKWYKNNVT